MGRWTGVKLVDANNFVVGTRCQVAAIGRKADGVDGAEVMAHVTELARLDAGGILGSVDGFSRPDADMTVYNKEQSAKG